MVASGTAPAFVPLRTPGGNIHELLSGERRGAWAALQRLGLHAASLPYSCAIGVRNQLYDLGWKKTRHASVPVVSIGNLTVGGTGKTPCVEYVASFFRKLGLRPAILSRGYGAEAGPNDEALLLEENLPDVPHLQGADRRALAEIAVGELESQVLVLDDGFQHRQLHRNLDLVTIDATNPWGHGHVLPRGLLREKPHSLRRAGAIVLTRCDQAMDRLGTLRQKVTDLAPRAVLAETSHRPIVWLHAEKPSTAASDFGGRRAAAFCGIGNPAAFKQTLADLDIQVTSFRCFPDHHGYTRADVEDLRSWARAQSEASIVVTTQKDSVKLHLPQLGGKDLWALRIGLSFHSGQDALEKELERVVDV